MKIIICRDDGTEQTFQHVTDYFLAVRYLDSKQDDAGNVFPIPEIRSFSHGRNLRELAKELGQALVEIQEHLKNANRP